MAIIHDNPETRIGDMNKLMKLYLEKGNSEVNAFKDQIKKLPDDVISDLKDHYFEYEERNSLEARIVKDADTLELGFQSLEYLQIGYSAHLNWLEDLESRLHFDISKEIFREMRSSDINDWWKDVI